MTGSGIEVDGLDTFVRTARAAADQLEDLTDAHRAAGEVLVNRPQPRIPSIAADVAYDVDTGVTALTGDVIYAGTEGDGLTADQTAEIVAAFVDEIDQIIHSIKGA